MIRIFEGVPGSGKTYAMVYYLRKFAEYDDFYKEWVLKDGVCIISNIDGLRLPHMSLDKFLEELSLSQVFSADFVNSLRDKGYKHIIFVIDEAQRYFPRKFYDEDVFYFFQYHRHYGVDILLATQDTSVIAREIRVLAEFIIRAEQRSLTLKSFKYKFYTPDNKTHLFNQTLPKKQEVFSMYKSFDFEEADKPPNVLLRQLVIPAFLFFLLLFGAYYYVTHVMFPKPQPASEPELKSKPPEPVPVEANPAPSVPSGGIPSTGYISLGSLTFYFTPYGIFLDKDGSCSYFAGSLVCAKPVPLYRSYIPSPSPPPSPSLSLGKPTVGGLVNIENKSHTPSPSPSSSFPALVSGGGSVAE